MKIFDKYSKEEIGNILKESDSFRNFLEKIGCKSTQSHVYRKVHKELKELDIEYSFDMFKYERRVEVRKSMAISDDKLFVADSKFSTWVKERIISKNLIPYVCEKCNNNGLWNNDKLSLQLDHKNGVNSDNRIENLRFLCPNCHSQTHTFCGRNFKKKEKRQYKCGCGVEIARTSKTCKSCYDISQRKADRPLYDDLITSIELLGYKKTAEKYKVTDGAIRKWIIYYNNTKNEN